MSMDADAWVEWMERYYEVAADGTSLLTFLQDVLAGRYGPADRTTLTRFLDHLETIILGNIELKREEAAGADADAAYAATEAEFAQARALVAELGS
jgi:hypothetical protein